MLNKERVRSAMFVASLKLTPPLIRDQLLSDEALRNEYGIDVDSVLSLGGTGIAFKRSALFGAVRTAASVPGKGQKVQDQSGVDWTITVRRTKKEVGLKLCSGKRSIRADHFLLLSKDKGLRKRFFAEEAVRLNMGAEAISRWNKALSDHPLSDEELSALLEEAAGQSPIAITSIIVERLEQSNIPLDILVPRSPAYYERLVGRVEQQPTIKEYVDEVADSHIRQLMSWRPLDGLQLALLLCSHSLMTKAIAHAGLSGNLVRQIAQWALGADVVTQGAVVEVALQRAEGEAEYGTSIRELAEKFCGHGQVGRYDPFSFLSVAFIVVYGELAHARIMATKPPYWRRLAALAQAALIVRCVYSIEGDLTGFVNWMRSARTTPYLMQCFADLRNEPRWLADFAMPRQLNDEIGGRVLMAAASNEGATETLGLRELLLSDAAESLKSNLNLLFSQLPGPLEGNVDAVYEMPEEHLRQMRADLTTATPTVASFAILCNTALLFKLPDDVPGLAADALRRAQYHLDGGKEPESAQSCLVGLAAAAAAFRSEALANEIFVVIRNYRRNFKDVLTLDGAFRIGMIASASRQDMTAWCKCVGALISDLGFGPLDREEASSLHPLVTELCHIVPELWATCSQGLAAIEAVALS